MDNWTLYKIIVFSILLKLSYVAFAFFVENVDSNFSFEHSVSGIVELFKRHDASWYKEIHDKGYPVIHSKSDLGWNDGSEYFQSAWGFMPGYPLLVKSVSIVLNTRFETSAFLLSFLLSILSFILFYKLAVKWFASKGDAYYSTLLFMFMPFQYYFSMMYTEGLFCCLLIGALLAIEHRKYFLLGLLCSVLVLVRANGIVMLLPITIYLMEHHNSYPIRIKQIFDYEWLKKFSFLILPLLSLSAYCIYQYINTGYYNAYSIAQKGGWYREFMFPLAGLFRSGDFVSQFNSWYAILFMVLALLVRKKLSLSFNFIIWLNILLPLSAGSSVAMTRYTIILFPLFFVFALWLKDQKWKYKLIPVVFSLQMFAFYFWLIGSPFSH